MTDKEKLDRLVAEIERRYKEQNTLHTSYSCGRNDEDAELLSFYDSLQEDPQVKESAKTQHVNETCKENDDSLTQEPISDDLEEAIDTYLATYFGSEKEKQEWPFLKKMAIHFANWKEQQLMAKAVDGNKAGNREQLSPEMKALLSQKVEELDLSVRTRNILKANDIDTIRDLCRLKKIDFLYFRNGGKRSLTELDDFLTAHNLTWGMNV